MADIIVYDYIVLNEKTMRRIAFMTYRNAHGEAYQLGAEMLGLSELAERFAGIESQRQQLGYLSQVLCEERRNAYDELMSHARTHMSDADFQQFYMAF